jgi:formamidopyrimidine-DNA glycosylase
VPELPDITVYIEALEARVLGQVLEKIRLASPFVVRSATPPVREAEGRRVIGLRRLGKRIAFALDGDLFLVVHLMISGRFRWKERGAKIPGKLGLLAVDFPTGTLLLTEASTKKRASVHLVSGEAALADFDRGGLEVLGASQSAFKDALMRENHTLKRALTDPRLFSGIGNAYSDEILHSAKLSPVKLSRQLTDEEVARLLDCTKQTLVEWTDRLRAEADGGFPENVTAFRPEMAVHGKYKQPCPVCGTAVQRIVHAENETNYCPRCQTGGKLLADRSLSRLLKDDWPKTVDELEQRLGRA